MSRIGNKPVKIPEGVEVTYQDGVVTASKGNTKLEQKVDPCIKVKIEDGLVHFIPQKENKETRAMHGLYRSLVQNMVTGLTKGYKKELAIMGVGYRAELQAKKLVLTVGFSHKVEIDPPEGITFEVPKETAIIISGPDKQLVGEVTAKIRAIRPPEPYKGKGIRYKDEVVHLRVGKTAAK